MTFSSIDPREMHQLGSSVQNAGKGLAECAAQLRVILNEVELTHPGVVAIGRAGQWLTEQAPDLYRRRDLAYEAEKIDVDVFGNPLPGKVVPPGMTRIDESRMISGKVRADARHVASLVAAAARGDARARENLAAYEGRLSDPQFATALIEQLGPRGLLEIPAIMGTRVRKTLDADPDSAESVRRQNRDVLSMLSRALATATNVNNTVHVGRKFTEELKRQGRAEIPAPDMGGLTNPGYWSLGQVLAAAPDQAYSEWFMRTVGQDMIRWDRDYLRAHRTRFLPKDTDVYNLPAPIDTRPFQGSSVVGAADPIAALMNIASTSRERAQALLDDKDLMKYLLGERRAQWEMGDRGESLGATMEAAMKEADADSKRLAVWAGQILADQIKAGISVSDTGDVTIKNPSEFDRLSGIRDNMGRIMAEHSDDIVFSYFIAPKRAAGEPTGDVEGKTTARFNPTDLDLVMLDVAIDDQGYEALLRGEIADMRGKIDEAMATGNGKKLDNVIALNSKAMGHLLEARRIALVSRGKEADAADEELRKLIENGIGLVPVPFAERVGKLGVKAAGTIYESFVQGGYKQAGDWLAKNSGHAGKKASKAFSEAATNDIAAQELVKQMLASSTVAHGAYDREDLKRSFVIGDPPRVKDPRDMTEAEYESFLRWMADNTTMPADFTEAQESASVGGEEFRDNLKAAVK
ncbi:hypothetical protein [Nonomuraea candida]|uniref:hypothetical protein n=1 Tax=Nonomuraea candida TaxID=359159 RepID=UPI0012FB5029|nr:hypothetical protein [Nonomuraea candida]